MPGFSPPLPPPINALPRYMSTIHSPLKPEPKAEAEQASKSNPLARLNEIMAKMQLDEQGSKRRAEEENNIQEAMMTAYFTVPYGAGMPPAYPPMGFVPGPAFLINTPWVRT